MIRWLLHVVVVACALHWVEAAEYREKLVLHPLPQSSLLAAFNFQSNTSIAEFEQQNYNLFPRSLGQILLHAHAEELHLRFALGRWDGESWGARPRGGRREGGTGVELWAWVQADSEEEANARWFTLTNALSGLFCASINFVDQTKTIRPVSSFDREGNKPASDLHLLHGALPHEVVCTENLTPFLKLLPCKGKAGISSLLDGHKLFDASWQTMAIDVRKNCPTQGECQIEIEQTVDMVLDIERSMRPVKDPIPRPPPIESISCNTTKPYNGDDTCFPEDMTEERAWSLKEIFGRPIRGSCPLNNPSKAHPGDVELIIPSNRKVTTDIFGRDIAAKISSPTSRIYQLPDAADFDLKVTPHPVGQDFYLSSPQLKASRTFTGYGQERGGVHTVLTNLSPDPVDIVYLESLPWFMKPYLHTLSTTLSPSSPLSPITNILYRPALDRQRGTHLELTLQIPASSTLTLSYYFEKAILRYTEYPPDANRGFDVAPAVIRILPSNSTSGQGRGKSTYLRTTSLLLPLPTPDFSMPYNVIILTSTVIAMGFGSIFNLITRRFVAAEEAEGVGLGGVKERIRERVGALVAKFGRGQKAKTGEGGDAKWEKDGVEGKVNGISTGLDAGNGSVRSRKA
ncbi:GPI transamidase component GPI16-like protein [Elsinoe fawcettii]|nr:GPI transamidase component GPI16-like protein [Elsinoe fawcettii]